MLRIFTSVKIQQLRPGLNQQTWVPEASMLTTRPPKPSYCSYNWDALSKFIFCHLIHFKEFPESLSWRLYAQILCQKFYEGKELIVYYI